MLFDSLKIELFPMGIEQLSLRCTCPDKVSPCKHTLATLFHISTIFASDPFLLFSWRGKTQDELMQSLLELRKTSSSQLPIPDVPEVEETLPLSARLHTFWVAGESLTPPVNFSAADILKRLGPPPVEIGGERLSQRLMEIYRRVRW